jgi:hypothetical protein
MWRRTARHVNRVTERMSMDGSFGFEVVEWEWDIGMAEVEEV